jgi:hypothetical protein
VQLTRKQSQLTGEVNLLLDLLNLSPDVSKVDPELRTTHLELAKRGLVISGVLGRYLLMDELLNDLFCRQFFPRERAYPDLWRTKKFKAFNYYVLERIYLVQKAEFVRNRIRMPNKVYKDLLALNDLRNALAHSFFPENRRVKPGWKGSDIFSPSGFEQFWQDMSEVSDFFFNHIRRGNRSRKSKQDNHPASANRSETIAERER